MLPVGVVFISVLINCVLDIAIIFVKKNYLSITIADERRRCATKASSQMSGTKSDRFSFVSYSHLRTKYLPFVFG